MEGKGPHSFTFPEQDGDYRIDGIVRDVEGIIRHETRDMEGRPWHERLLHFQTRRSGRPWSALGPVLCPRCGENITATPQSLDLGRSNQ
jgi:hypothetical protein